MKISHMLSDPTHVCMCACSVASVIFKSLQPHGLLLTRFLCPWNSSGKNTGVGCHDFLQGIFPARGLKPCLFDSCITGRFFAKGATWEAQAYIAKLLIINIPYQSDTFVAVDEQKECNHSKSIRDQTLISSICSTFFTTAPSG